MIVDVWANAPNGHLTSENKLERPNSTEQRPFEKLMVSQLVKKFRAIYAN
jgi:hypothetical protein